jgi:hypothetical protein
MVISPTSGQNSGKNGGSGIELAWDKDSDDMTSQGSFMRTTRAFIPVSPTVSSLGDFMSNLGEMGYDPPGFERAKQLCANAVGHI